MGSTWAPSFFIELLKCYLKLFFLVSNGPYGAPIFPLNFNRLPSFFIDFRRTTKMTIMKYFFLFFIDTHLLKIFFTAYSLKFNDTHLLKFFFTAYSLKFNDSLKTDFRP